MTQSARCLIPVILLLLAGPGCSRKFFRNRADADVEGIITQKNQFPDWAVKNWFVYPHPDARFADPYNPDRPPYPPDDFAARVLSPNPQHPTKRTGTGRFDGEGYMRILTEWDAENRAQDAADAGVGVGVNATDSGIVRTSAQVKTDVPPLPAVPTTPVTQPKKDGLPNAIPQPPGTEPVDPKDGTQPGQFPTIQSLIALGGSPDDFLRALQSNQEGYRIRADQAVQLGVINSREFQDRREDLYLAALPVTLERYNFAAQAFFAEQVIRDFTGSGLAGGGSRLWSLNTQAGVRKNFATGGSLLVRLANQVVIDLGSGRPDIAVSNLSLSFIQPFLRGGGFAVNLEPLTQSERNLLYGMRSYARFRKLFYVATVAGPAGGLGLTNNPYSLQGLSVNLGRGIGGNLTSPVIGYLPLLQQSAIIANQRKNVAFLGQLLRLYQAFREGGQQSDLQVGQVEVQLLNSRGQLLGSPGSGGGGGSGIRGFLDALDSYKLQLGLPVTIGLDLDDTPLKPIRDQLGRFEDIYADLARFETVARQYNLNDPIADFRARWRALLTDSDLVRGTNFAKVIGARLDALARLSDDALVARVAEVRRQRTALLDARAKRQLEGKPEPPAEIQRLAALEGELDLAAYERTIRIYLARPWMKIDGPARAASQAGAFRDVFYAFYQVALEARNERLADIRTKWPDLPPLMVSGADLLETDLDEAYTLGVQAALSSRLDLMNARAQVVDAYRQIAVQANSLQGVFNVEYDLDAASPAGGSKPFDFSGSRTRHTLTLTGELPLIRRAERNNYRAALISYQRQRRTLMAFEDNIASDVRNDIRELRTQAQLYKIQQRVVDLGYSQVDNAKELLLAPPVPVGATPGAFGGSDNAGSAAALTQQVLQAQSSLLNAQNALYTLWVNYTTARMNLYLDLELMQLDDRGVWYDEQITRPDIRRPGPFGQPAERIPAPQPVGPADRK